MRLLLLLLSGMIFSSAFAQHPTCDGTRYVNPTFTPNSTTGLLYGNANTFAGNNLDLYLDFFEPAGDVATERPLIILAFGGSFIQGTRDDMHWMCEYFTSLGYTAAAIDYRLYDGPLFPFPDSVDMTKEVLLAVSDMKAAIRFFKEDAANANTYKVDTNYIFVGGISSGGIVAAHTALLDSTDVIEPYIQPLIANNGGWTGNSSTNTQHTDAVRGVLNYSGALRKSSYIDASDPAIFSVHDDGDDVVPYAYGDASVFGQPIIGMEGSFLMDQQAQTVSVGSELVTVPNSNGHVSYFGTAQGVDSVMEQSTAFLYEIVCPQFAQLDEVAENEVMLYPNPADEKFTLVSDKTLRRVEVFDLSGKLIFVKEMNGTEAEISTSNFNSGAYLVKTYGTSNLIKNLRVLVVH